MEIKQRYKYLVITILFGIIVFLLMTGCSIEQPVEITPSPTTILTETSTITVTKTPRPTRTNTPTVTNDIKSNDHTDFSIIEDCLPLQENRVDFHLEENLIISGSNPSILDHNLEPWIELPVVNEPYYYLLTNYIVSPDYTHLAYTGTQYVEVDNELIYYGNYLHIYDISSGEFIYYEWNPLLPRQQIIEWFDNDRILISSHENRDGTITLLNPFTGISEQIKSDLPNIYELDEITWYKSHNPLPLYNESINKVFYLRFANEPGISNMRFALVDLINNEELWSGVVNHPQTRPLWSPNQDQIVYVARDSSKYDYEFFSIDINGVLKKISELSSYYDETYITQFSWSPDGKKIAFWLWTKSNQNESFISRLAILDISRNHVIDYCIPQGGAKILWSPSGNQIAFTGGNHDNYTIHYGVIVDLNQHIAVKFTEGNSPEGWLIN